MVKNYQNFVNNILSNIFFEIFGHFWAKNLKGWSHKLETLHKENLGPVLKKSRK
jgi:hypothetical protein